MSRGVLWAGKESVYGAVCLFFLSLNFLVPLNYSLHATPTTVWKEFCYNNKRFEETETQDCQFPKSIHRIDNLVNNRIV
jgi:hypothetical protein